MSTEYFSADTIAAIATPPGKGGVGIVRISGPLAFRVAQGMLGRIPAPRYAEYLPFYAATGEVLDMGLALCFPGPHSFTGEDILELQGHGGPVVLDRVLAEVMAQGARQARPGEFLERAFLNDKIDLAQAEAVADLIDSASVDAARLAMQNLQGVFSRHIQQLQEQLIHARMYVESAIDFPEEEIDFLADPKLIATLQELLQALKQTLASARQGQLLQEGARIVISGRPNAGKSTLLNRFTGQDTAIVTDIPGTTRDVLRAHIVVDGLPLHIIDTAGLRTTTDVVEQEGVRRAWLEIEQADHILYLIDAATAPNLDDLAQLNRLLLAGPRTTLVLTKTDAVAPSLPELGQKSDSQTTIFRRTYTELPVINISAKTGFGLADLIGHLKQMVGFQSGEGRFIARRRHLEALQQALVCVENGYAQLIASAAGELLAEELRAAQQALSRITGEHSADELLGQIFSRFCIGK